jgi:energy-converting hydrogenase A subunit C
MMIPVYDPNMIPIYLCGIVAVYAVIRVVLEKHTLRKLVFLSVMNFAITGLIVLTIPDIMALFAGLAYYIGSNLEANAIASTYVGGEYSQ